MFHEKKAVKNQLGLNYRHRSVDQQRSTWRKKTPIYKKLKSKVCLHPGRAFIGKGFLITLPSPSPTPKTHIHWHRQTKTRLGLHRFYACLSRTDSAKEGKYKMRPERTQTDTHTHTPFTFTFTSMGKLKMMPTRKRKRKEMVILATS